MRLIAGIALLSANVIVLGDLHSGVSKHCYWNINKTLIFRVFNFFWNCSRYFKFQRRSVLFACLLSAILANFLLLIKL